MADRFYCPNPIQNGRAVLEGDEARHLIKVRRVALGETVEIFDGRGNAFQARVENLARDRADLVIVATNPAQGEASCRLTLASAIPKGDRVDWLVEKATELGVDRIIPLTTARSVVDPRSTKIDRLRRVTIEASKQCRRDRLMELAPPTTWAALLTTSRQEIRLVAHPGERGLAASGLSTGVGSAILAIGPEGGLTSEERDQAVVTGWKLVGLGSTILRVETAGLAGCSTILALTETIREKEQA